MKTNIFSNKITSVLLCLVVCLLWGSLYPMIKVGYSAFEIVSGDIPSIVLFAGLRFFVSGIILILFTSVKEKKFVAPQKSNIKYVFWGAFFTIILHYTLSYIALSMGESSKSAIVKQIGYLFLSCFPFLFDKNDKWSFRKTIAGIIGFCGIVATNSGGGGFVIGLVDIILISSSFCSSYGSVVAKKSAKVMSSAIFVAYSQLFGGFLLSCAGLLLGGRITHFDLKSLFVFLYICAASICSYLLWNVLLKYNSLSKLAIIKFAEPLFAVILSGLILFEDVLKVSYLVALILIFSAILIENVKSHKKAK